MSRSQCELLYAKSLEEKSLFSGWQWGGWRCYDGQEDRAWGQGKDKPPLRTQALRVRIVSSTEPLVHFPICVTQRSLCEEQVTFNKN